MFDHDQFYTECNKRFKRREIFENLMLGVIILTISIACTYLLLAIFNPDIYLCR